MKLIALTILMLCSLVFFTNTKADETTKTLFNQASDLYEKKQFDQAALIWGSIYNNYSTSSDRKQVEDALKARFYQAALFMRFYEPQKALDYCLQISKHSKVSKDNLSNCRELKAYIYLTQKNILEVKSNYEQEAYYIKSLEGEKPTSAEWLNHVIQSFSHVNYSSLPDAFKRIDELVPLYDLAITHFYRMGDPINLHLELSGLIDVQFWHYEKVDNQTKELELCDAMIDRFKGKFNDDTINSRVSRAMMTKSVIYKIQGKPYMDLALQSGYFKTTDQNKIENSLEKLIKFRIEVLQKKSAI